MPKTKNQPKKNKILNWFKPTSPAKGMLLFAIAFAVIGGGYMTYKSFAASGTITHAADKIYSIGNAYTSNDCGQGKNCIPIWVIVKGGGVGTNFGYVPENGSIACFTARKAVANQTGTAKITVLSTNQQTKNFSLSTTYSTKCIDRVPKGYVLMEAQNIGDSNIIIANMSIEYGTVL